MNIDLEKIMQTGAKVMDSAVKTANDLAKQGKRQADLLAAVKLEREVKFITSQELEDLYPDLTPNQRENAITKEYKTVFLMQIG